MGNIKEILHTKRTVTEEHIKLLQREGKEGIRYTAMMPDIPFLIFGIICDIGWLIHLIAGIAGGVIGTAQIAAYTSVAKPLVWMAAGGLHPAEGRRCPCALISSMKK